MSTVKQDIHISRISIVDRDFKIFGYKLVFIRNEKEKLNLNRTDSQKIVKFIADFGIRKFVGDKYGFISIDEKIIDEDLLELIPPENVFFELEIGGLDEFIIKKLRAFHERGYRFSINESILESIENLHGVFDIVEINPCVYLNLDELKVRVNQLKNSGINVLALNVSNQKQFEMLKEVGFDFFMGNFVKSEKNFIRAKDYLSPSKSTVLELYNKILSGAELDEIESVFKKSPDLSYKLLKLINSAYFGLRTKVSSIRHALVLLGLKNLRKWVLFMLYAEDFTDIKSNPFFVQSILRAKIMEKLCLKICDDEQAEKAFLTGIISNLHVVLGISKDDMLEEIGVDEEIKKAILNREGKIGKLLTLIEGLENQDFDLVVSVSKELNIPMTDVLMAETLSILEIEKSKY